MRRQEERLPGALVVGQDHAGRFRHVFMADDFYPDVEEHPRQPQRATAPVNVDESIARTKWQERRDEETQCAPQQGGGAQQQVKAAMSILQAIRTFFFYLLIDIA